MSSRDKKKRRTENRSDKVYPLRTEKNFLEELEKLTIKKEDKVLFKTLYDIVKKEFETDNTVNDIVENIKEKKEQEDDIIVKKSNSSLNEKAIKTKNNLILMFVFLMLITLENNVKVLEKYKMVVTSIEADKPELSGIHYSPFINVKKDNETQYQNQFYNIYSIRHLFNLALEFSYDIKNKYSINSIFYSNAGEVVEGADESNHSYVYFMSYTHLLKLLSKILPKPTQPEEKKGGIKIRIRIIKKYK